MEKDIKQWQENEKRKKQTRKRAYLQRPYPDDNDIHGRKKVRTDEQTN